MSVLLLGLLLAGTFFGLHTILRRRGDERLYRRVMIISAAIIIAIAWGLFAATQLGFIPDHAP
jgi:hypothetical protein